MAVSRRLRGAALLLGWMGAGLAAAQALQEPQVVRAWFDDPALVDRIAPELGHAQVDRAKGLLRLEADAAMRARLQAIGFRLETDPEATAAIHEQLAFERAGLASIGGYACYRTVEETETTMTALAQAAPGLVEILPIGPTWQALDGVGGYQLKVARVTNRNLPGPKPTVFIMASMHAREYAPAELATRLVESLVQGYGTDPDATWLLDHHEVHALLQANPDGRKRAEAGVLWRKNENIDHCSVGSAPGVDLNRNYPFEWGNWGGSSGSACSETFRGPSPASEPETQAVIDYVRATFPDRRGPALTDPADSDTQGVFFDLHSYSGLMLWPWGFTTTPAPNATALQAFGRRMAYFNNYTPQAAVGLYATDGTTDDFAYGELGLPSFTYEVGTAFFQDCASFQNTILPTNLAALRYGLRAARAPYRWPLGPDAVEVRTQPDLVVAGAPVQVLATLDDSRQKGGTYASSGPVPPVQSIAAASAWLGVPPWSPGAVAQPMQAVDGVFNSTAEAATATLDTTALPPGRHLVFVQGRDTAGHDGPPAAAFVDVYDAADIGTLQGTVRQAGTAQPLVAQLQVGDYSATSAADGQYSRSVPDGSYAVTVSADGHERLQLPPVAIAGGAVVQRDVTLFQLCGRIDDPVEPGQPSSFTATAPWTLRSGQGQGGGAAWLPTAGSTYANNLNVSLTSAALDLSAEAQLVLSFDQRCDTEATYDFGIVEISSNGGASWTEVFRCDGETAWRRVSLPLDALAGAANARLRFRFTSDPSQVGTGWALDNIRLDVGGQACRDSQGPSPVGINSFSATPSALIAGDSTTLAWQTVGATACGLANSVDAAVIALGAGELASGQRVLSPTVDTVYTLACEGHDGPVSAQAAVTVTVPEPVRIDGFSATPSALIEGESTTLAWQTAGATACGLANSVDATVIALGAGELASGQRVLSPTVDTVYTLRCEGYTGPVSAQAAVTVTPPDAPQVLQFTATPAMIASGASSTLAWQTAHAGSCVLRNSLDATVLSIPAAQVAAGSRSVTPPASVVYTLACSGAGGSTSAETAVVVDPPVLLSDGFEAAGSR